jgi:opacity protein-like surface antigen
MKKIILIVLLASFNNILSQNLLDVLENETPKQKDFVTATFKGTRILNGHSIENRKKGTLEFLISHRFGRIDQGIDQLFGLDQSNIRFAFEYGLTDRLMLGLGRSSFNKTYDGFAKLKLIKQARGHQSFPLSVSLFGSIAYKTLKDYAPENKPDFSQRLAYTSQVLIASKISNSLSLQITPTYIHNNSIKTKDDTHNIFAIGIGNRIKLSNRVTLNTEYFYTINPLKSINSKNALAIGVDIETGGHVFQLILSNSITMIERDFITETTSDFFEGGIHFGFNISRAFQIGRKKQ